MNTKLCNATIKQFKFESIAGAGKNGQIFHVRAKTLKEAKKSISKQRPNNTWKYLG